jgi:phosphoribosylaminoimidazolecarboxamide formyltransferase/IMP cyclohydrolase
MAQASTEVAEKIDEVRIRRALLSVFDKSGLENLARSLAAEEVELFSTGGTEQFLREKGFAVKPVTDLTDFPEMLDGRVKTLHPAVHGGLLYRRELASHREQVKKHKIAPIDLLVVNLYPFEETVAKAGATSAEIIEQIDIGGPAMLRSAAKNFVGVALLTSPSQYAAFISSISSSNGETSLELRRTLAAEAFAAVAHYDAAISKYFDQLTANEDASFTLDLPKVQSLRYGENPHQSAALFGNAFNRIFKQIWGKELSYNNILDISAATGLMAEFFDSDRATSAIIKHTNPCGVAEGADLLDAFDRAFRSDTESPYGGIVIVNGTVELSLAERLNGFFSEVILAPKFAPDALTLLQKKKDRRLVTFDIAEVRKTLAEMQDVRSVIGGILVQSADRELFGATELKSITERQISYEELRALTFSWRCVKHVKSNAIVYAGLENGFARTLGIGCGQTSRVESSRLAVQRARYFKHDLKDSFVASDAFFPFADGLTEAIAAGAIAVIQPGGSVRDAEVIAEAEQHHISMVLTGMRHFRH